MCYLHIISNLILSLSRVNLERKWFTDMDDPLSRPIYWVVIGICLLISFFSSTCETAIGLVNRFKLQVKADDGSKTAKILLKICDHYDRTISTVLITHNIAAIVLSTISTILFYAVFEKYTDVEPYVPIISSIVVTFAVYILGDIFPKTIAKKIPDTISTIFAWPLYIILIVLTPISILFELLAKAIDKIFKTSQDEEFTEEDFENIVEKTTDEGILEEEQGDIIQSALEFEDTNVKEVLTPRNKMFALDIRGLTHEKLQEILLTTNYSRIPIYEREFDNFIGVLHIKNYIKQYMENPNMSIRRMLQKPYFVSGKIMIDDLFNGFKKHRSHLAIVRNKDRKVIGMVTMEDVLEELVEDISEPNTQKVRKV